DRIRRSKTLAGKLETYAVDLDELGPEPMETSDIPDARLRLLFSCCHPALAREAQIALTLRTLTGLETEEIARAFLVPVATMAQRLGRAEQEVADGPRPPPR